MTKKIVIRGLKFTSLTILLIALETMSATVIYITLVNAGLPRSIDRPFVIVLLLILSLLCLRVIPTHFLDLETESKDALWKTSVDSITALTHGFFQVHTRGNNQHTFNELLEMLYVNIGESEIAKEETTSNQQEMIDILSTAMAGPIPQAKEKKRTPPQKDPEVEKDPEMKLDKVKVC